MGPLNPGLIPMPFAVDLLNPEPSRHPAGEQVSIGLTLRAVAPEPGTRVLSNGWQLWRLRVGNGSVPLS
jgi:hypothetical protein